MTLLRGKRALVTGGTRGIGFAIAERLRHDGASVFITGTKASTAENYFAVDFAHETQLSDFTSHVRDLRLDILINNAGITAVGDFHLITKAQFDAVEQVNVRAPFLLSQSVLPSMRENNWGRIVNISSIFGIIGRDQRAPYCMSKFAIDGMTAALSAEVAQYGVLVNSVCPGFIDTELTRSVLSAPEIEELVAKVPSRRLGRPDEVAALVSWLAGPENTFISGQHIAIDGGYTRV